MALRQLHDSVCVPYVDKFENENSEKIRCIAGEIVYTARRSLRSRWQRQLAAHVTDRHNKKMHILLQLLFAWS